jgi:hypothetical protein
VYRLAYNGDIVGFKMGRRPIFNPTLRTAAGWLFLRVARSLRIDSDMLVARALKNSQLTCGDAIIICETVHSPANMTHYNRIDALIAS